MSRQDVPEQLFPGPLLREITSLEFTLITGINRSDSTMDRKLVWKGIRALKSATEPDPIRTDGTETVLSKVKHVDLPSPEAFRPLVSSSLVETKKRRAIKLISRADLRLQPGIKRKAL
jgi:hypothetical protein